MCWKYGGISVPASYFTADDLADRDEDEFLKKKTFLARSDWWERGDLSFTAQCELACKLVCLSRCLLGDHHFKLLLLLFGDHFEMVTYVSPRPPLLTVSDCLSMYLPNGCRPTKSKSQSGIDNANTKVLLVCYFNRTTMPFNRGKCTMYFLRLNNPNNLFMSSNSTKGKGTQRFSFK